MIIRNLSLVLVGFVLLAGCNKSKVALLEKLNDSLKLELQARNAVIASMHEADNLLDSIDHHRNILQQIEEGPVHERFSDRLQEIKDYVKSSEEKMERFEKDLRSKRNEAFAYMMMVDALKSEVGIRATEVEQLEDTVDLHLSHKVDLQNDLKSHQAEMAQLLQNITEKERELSNLKTRMHEIVRNAEAEAFYAKGKNVEESAKKIKLAPAKKRDTMKEALELFKKAYALGKSEAKVDIDNLNRSINSGSELTAANEEDDESSLQ
jgi:hypothetical protein